MRSDYKIWKFIFILVKMEKYGNYEKKRIGIGIRKVGDIVV